MHINKQDFLNLQTLLTEKTITAGKFSNKDIIEKLLANGAVTLKRPTPKRKIVHLLKSQNIFLFLNNNNYNIKRTEDIDSYIEAIIDANPSRDTIQEWHNDTKAKNSESLKGLYISSLQNVNIRLNDEEIVLTPFKGLGYFLFHTERVELAQDITIVGVENYQVIWFAKKYSQFFDNEKTLFVVINPYMLEWISGLTNEYIHFGDYDLAGISIYLNKIAPRLEKAQKHSMFIPENIEYLIKEHGDRRLYEQQSMYKNLVTEDDEILNLIKLIRHCKKGLEQEGIHLL